MSTTTTAALSKYIQRVLGTTHRIFDYGFAHTAPSLEKDQLNRILVYPGSFNPPHIGHRDLLDYAFHNSSRDLNVIAAIILPLDEDSLARKFEGEKETLILSKEQRVSLWNGDHKLGPGPSFWVFGGSTDEWPSFQHHLSEATAKDGFEISFIALAGPDYVRTAAVPIMPVWGCKDIIVSDISRTADFTSHVSKERRQLNKCESWEAVMPIHGELKKRAEEGASWIYSGLCMMGPKAFQSMTHSDPDSISKTTEELYRAYVNEYQAIKICHRKDDENSTIRFIAAKSKITEISSTKVRQVIKQCQKSHSYRDLEAIVLSPQLLIQYVSNRD